jgi:cytochrome c biogenesis protein CcmG, thiol:disulfide interchange protein DsbE
MIRTLVALGVVTAMNVAVAYAIGPEMIGKPAPVFALKTIDGRSTVSLQDCRGKVVIIDFWATWCVPCRRSLPRLVALEAGTSSVKLLAINIDDERENAIEFLKRNRIKFASLYDETKRVASQYNVPEMPSALIVDAHGVVRFVHAGYNESEIDSIRKEVESLL